MFIILPIYDSATTPDQRFWVAKIMGTTLAMDLPDIDADDPAPVEGITRELFSISQ